MEKSYLSGCTGQEPTLPLSMNSTSLEHPPNWVPLALRTQFSQALLLLDMDPPGLPHTWICPVTLFYHWSTMPFF